MKNFLLKTAFFFIGCSALLPAGCKKSEYKVVAKVGSVKITQSDFSKELTNLPPSYQNYLSTMEGKKQFLDVILREKILLNAAIKSGVSKKKELQNHLKEYQQRIKAQESEFRKSLILREYLRELQDGELKITDPELKLYFDENKEEFQNPLKVAASHILCTSQEDAEKALARLQKGEDFSKVAQEVSTDPSAERGGLIGEVSRGDLGELPEFEKELFNLKSGKISGVVKTKIGYHIIKKSGEVRLPSQTFEQATPQIRRVLEKKKFDQWVEKTKKEQKVWVDDKVLASIPIPEAQSDMDVPPSTVR